MSSAVKFAIFVLALVGACIAQDGLAIDNNHKEKVSNPEAEKIYSSACSVVQGIRHQAPAPSTGQTCSGGRQERGMVWRDEKSGLLNGTVTPSHRESCGWPLRI